MKKYYILCLIVVSLIFGTASPVEAESDGGQISSPSGITFFTDDPYTTTDSSGDIVKPINPDKGTGGEGPTKTLSQENGKDLLPKTGEQTVNLTQVGIILIVFGTLGLMVIEKRRKI